MGSKITVEVEVKGSIDRVWSVWNDPKHITQWCSGHPDWHTSKAANDLRVGGQFSTRMEAKDGSMGFDMKNTYDEVIENKLLKYHMEDGRECKITFEVNGDQIVVKQNFDPESENTPEQQREGWQTIMNNFKAHFDSL